MALVSVFLCQLGFWIPWHLEDCLFLASSLKEVIWWECYAPAWFRLFMPCFPWWWRGLASVGEDGLFILEPSSLVSEVLSTVLFVFGWFHPFLLVWVLLRLFLRKFLQCFRSSIFLFGDPFFMLAAGFSSIVTAPLWCQRVGLDFLVWLDSRSCELLGMIVSYLSAFRVFLALSSCLETHLYYADPQGSF